MPATPVHVGVGFPFTLGDRGFLSLKADEELVRDSVIQILGTRRGERFMEPEFGSDLQSILFKLNDLGEGTSAVLSFRIAQALEQDNRLYLKKLVFDRTPAVAERGDVPVEFQAVILATDEPLTVRANFRSATTATTPEELS